MADTRIQAILEILLRGQGAKQASEQLDDVAKGGKKAQESVAATDKAAQQLGKTLVKFLGAAVLGRFVRSAIGAFADWERQLFATRTEANRLGMDMEDVARHARNLTEAIERQTGILRQDTIGVFNKFLGLTKDVEVATLLTNAAVGAQEGKYKDLQIAANLLGSTLLGEVIEPAKSLGITLDLTKNSAEQNADVMEEMLSKFLDLTGGIDDTRGALDSMRSKSNEVKLTLGEQLAPAVEVVNKVFGALLKSVQSAGALLGFFVNRAISIFGTIRRIAKAALDFRPTRAGILSFTGFLAAETGRVKTDMERDLSVLGDQAAEIWKSSGAGILQTEQDVAAALEKIFALTRARGAEADRKAAEDRAKKEAERVRREAEQRAAFEEQMEDGLLRARIQRAEEGSKERLRLELEMLKRLRERALDEAERLRADTETIDQLFDEMRAEREEENYETREERAREFLKNLVDMQNEAIKEEERLKDAAHRAELQRKREQQQVALDIAGQAVELGRALFGNNKAIAIADTIVYTARGVMSALSMFPPNLPLAGLVAATGAVQIARIHSTDVGGGGGGGAPAAAGFDNPAHDRLAYLTGRRWAEDMVHHVGSGFSAGMDESRMEPAAAASMGDSYNFSGPVFASRASWRNLERRIARERRRNRRRMIR